MILPRGGMINRPKKAERYCIAASFCSPQRHIAMQKNSVVSGD
jgi:hypothetical protein